MKTPETDALLKELGQLKSGTLSYPCEVRLTDLCRRLEIRHIKIAEIINGLLQNGDFIEFFPDEAREFNRYLKPKPNEPKP